MYKSSCKSESELTVSEQFIPDFPGKHGRVVSLELLDFCHHYSGCHFGFTAPNWAAPYREARVV